MYKVHRGEIEDTPYKHTPNTFTGLTLYFTSERAIERFEERLDNEVAKGNEKLCNIFKGMFDIDCSLLSAIRLYAREERRGFMVELDGVKYDKPNKIEFNLDA